MFRLKLYYHAKPFLPWSLRMAVRRFFAQRKHLHHRENWPIDHSTSAPPTNWSGWPEQKRFAFVLSHDVESQVGYDQLDQMLQVEEDLGFRSVINFIPEGQYNVTPERVQNLKSRTFEVGVHGLYHDGKLYNTKEEFERRAQRINHYLKKWDSTGFRSPLMHHNLDWLHSLNIAYDSSTFDTDPFEPQNDALGTIFPKWIVNPSRSRRPEVRRQESRGRGQSSDSSNQASSDGYVELPYTLPQDSTLYLLLKEQNIDIWKKKTAWIAKHGGMVFVNVHPDYIDFNGNGTQTQYQASHYADFLKHIKDTYTNQYWHATPNEVAKHFVNSRIW